MKLGPRIVAALILIGWSTSVFAQSDADTHDALARAAFCLGVLMESQQLTQTDPTTLVYKQQRYAKYLAIHGLNPSDPHVAIMMASGKSAARASREKHDRVQERCALECNGPQRPPGQSYHDGCLIPCVERSDQERANVLRCVISPVRMPF